MEVVDSLLVKHTFIENYLIIKVISINPNSIVYLTEDMKRGKKFIVSEFFPQELASRDSDGLALVIDDKELFNIYKELFLEDCVRFNEYTNMKIIKTLRTFEFNATVYAVSYYEGEVSLQKYLENKSLSILEIVILFNPLFLFLTSLHNKGNLYKNLHLGNFFVDKSGALILSQVSNKYSSYYEYYSPIEQYKNKGKLTIKSDIYALGALLYMLINGHPPIDANRRQNALDKGSSDPLKYLEIKEGYFQTFHTFVNEALSMTAEKRPSSMVTLQSLLKVKEKVNRKNPLEVLEEKKPMRTSLLHLVGIILISSVFYALVLDHGEVKITKDNVSYIDVLRYQWAGYWSDDTAQNALGTLYANGLEVERDLKKSIAWYEKAAKQGNIDAMLHLSNMYKNGEGVSKNREKSLEYLELAGQEEGISSQRKMGYNYFRGRGVKKDLKKAFALTQKSALRGDDYSMMLLGYMYSKGQGVHKDDTLALKWYTKAAKLGEKNASYYLGRAYEYAKGIPKNVKEAMFWYKASADKGNSRAMVRLGKKYYFGFKDSKREIKKDLVKARYWLTKAENLNNTTATKYLKMIDKEEDPKEIRRKKDKKIMNRMLAETKKNIYYVKKRFQPKVYGHFIDYGVYIKDTRTGLLWQKDGKASGKKNFYQAKEYVQNLKLGRLSGWRVPTRNELKMIFPALEIPFINTPKLSERKSYWTSERDYRLSDYAWVYHWYSNSGQTKGGANNCYASKNYVYVRAVHSPLD